MDKNSDMVILMGDMLGIVQQRSKVVKMIENHSAKLGDKDQGLICDKVKTCMKAIILGYGLQWINRDLYHLHVHCEESLVMVGSQEAMHHVMPKGTLVCF